MADVVGTIKVNAKLDSAGFEAGAKQVEATTDSLSANVGSKLATAAKVAGAATVAAIGKISASAVESYASFEQLEGGMQKIFDEMDYDTIAQDANNAWKSMNLSANQYMEAMTGVGATFAATMGDQKGYETAKTGLQAIADYASGTGKSVDLLSEKYQMISRSTSSYQSIADQFSGILPQTSADFLAQAQAAGYLSTSYTSLTDVPVVEYQQALTQMLEKGVDGMGLLGNTAAETDKTLSGSFNGMKSAWDNLKVAMAGGGDINSALESVKTSATSLLSNLLPVVQQIATNLPAALSELLPVLSETIISMLPSIITMLTELANGIILQLPTILEQIINGLIATLPALITGLVSVFTTLVSVLTRPDILAMMLNGAVQLFTQLVQALPQVIDALVGALPNIISAIIVFLTDPNTILQLTAAAIQLFLALVMAVPQILSSLIGAFGTLIGNVWNGITGRFQEFATNLKDTVTGIFKNAINSVLGFLESVLNGPINFINGIINGINSIVGVLGIHIGSLPTVSLPRLASGGYVYGAGTSTSDSIPALLSNGEYVVNAKAVDLVGREYLDSINSGQIPMGGGIQVNQTNNNYSQFDLDSANANLYNKLRTAHA